MPSKPKKCAVCKREFIPRSTTSKICSVDCAIEHAKIIAAKKQTKIDQIERKTHLEAIAKARPLSWYIRRAQSSLNRFIVHVRDKDRGCISCGTMSAGVYHAGHYIPTTRAIHRFNPDNIHKQCAQCNLFKSGNIALYRIALADRIGLDRIVELESTQHQLKRYTVDDLEAIRMKYKAKKSPSD